MNGFFQVDGPFFKFGNLLADMILLSLYWILFSIPVLTIGASTTALFYVSTRRINDKEGYLFRDFWKSFKLNFMQATLAWIFILILGGILLFNILNVEYFGSIKNFLFPIQLFFFFELFLISLFIFPLIARFEMNIKSLFKSAFLMANKHIVVSLFCTLVAAAVFFVSCLTGIVFLIAPGLYAFISSYFIMKVFKKYRPEIDESQL